MNSFETKSPYPYFGGKSRVAPVILKAFGDIQNYIEPFAGSLAVLLANTKIPKMETVNDINCFIVNFWRAVSNDPEEVAKIADYPVTQNDLHARHRWLLEQANEEFIKKIENDPNFFDAKIAAWWVYGISCSIGDNWLKDKGLKALPIISYAGAGIHGMSSNVHEWFKALQKRTRKVRITCTDWKKVVAPSITFKNKGLGKQDYTGVFLDPPYSHSGRDKVYLHDSDIYKEVCEWAVENGKVERMRIAVCGYEGSFKFPETWQEYSWVTSGGMANLGSGNDRGKDNSNKERIYFSPNCIKV